MESVLRRRLLSTNGDAKPSAERCKSPSVEDKVPKDPVLEKGTYWLTRIIILRYIGFIYFVAFLVAFDQNEALIGKNGLLPANLFLKLVENRTKNDLKTKLEYVPSLIWFFDYDNHLNTILNGIALLGLFLSGLVMFLGCANICVMILLWILYHSIVNVGQIWYSFGWESQLLETGFLSAFLCPLFTWKKFPEGTSSSFLIIFCFRWLIFRIMLGAGLIKVRGDKCWHDLTCMNYHYETQPVPNPLSYFMHQEPESLHKFEILVNHLIELIVPFFLLMPRMLCIVGGFLQILFQVLLILSGNLSFLNWLTITPSLACFDDKSLSWMFSHSSKMSVYVLQNDSKNKIHEKGHYTRKSFNVCFFLIIAYLSVPIIQNLFSSKQIMNTSFEPLRIVNTYGAFGSVTKKRTEVVFEGTQSLSPHDPNAKWLEYEFKCKPGKVSKRPCIISPYHYRLDWLMWFAAFQDFKQNNWLIHLGIKFLMNDNTTMTLIDHNPFKGTSPPKWIRADHYRYQFTKVWSNASSHGLWWKRSKIGKYLPPISLETVKDYAEMMHWPLLES